MRVITRIKSKIHVRAKTLTITSDASTDTARIEINVPGTQFTAMVNVSLTELQEAIKLSYTFNSIG